MSLLAWMISNAAAQTCHVPVQPAELEDALQRAETAYADMDEASFRDGVNEIADLLLPCLNEPLTPFQSGRTHRLMALHLVAIGDEDGGAQAAQAARRVDPETPFESALLPSTHPLALAWAAAEPVDRTRQAPEPRAGSVSFDGVHTRARPANRPTILQLFDETGQARTTTYLAPREALPEYRAIPRQRNLLLGCAAGGGATAVGLYAASWSARSRTFARAGDQSVDAVSLDRGRTTANLLAAGSAVVFGAGAACGASAAWIGER